MKKDPRQNSDRLISGRLRVKAGRGAAKNSVVTVDGTVYAWSVRHSWFVHGTGARSKAWSISVSLHPTRTRELILEFASGAENAASPKGEAALLSEIEIGIRLAREDGWDPESRGRAVRFTLGDLAGPDDAIER
ncbi:MAG: hypothetical protein ABI609_00615 [Acidobacteriota bacterium]